MSDDRNDVESEILVTSDVAPKEMITFIFEDDMIEKYTDEDGKPKWRCKWCSGIFLAGTQQRQYAI
jgi:hypothetical protein